MKPLTPAQRRDLRAKAHHLEPVVTVGHHGLTPAVSHEIDLALLAHELVKVKVLGDDRAAREALLAQACEALDCSPVQHVGKILVLWRVNPEKAEKAAKAATPRPAPPAKKKKAGPREPVDSVRERRRAVQSDWPEAPSGKGTRGAARNPSPFPPRDPAGARKRTGGAAPASSARTRAEPDKFGGAKAPSGPRSRQGQAGQSAGESRRPRGAAAPSGSPATRRRTRSS